MKCKGKWKKIVKAMKFFFFSKLIPCKNRLHVALSVNNKLEADF